MEILIRCSRPAASASDRKLHWTDGNLDWRRLLRLAAQHNMWPLLYSGLQAAEAGAVPEAVLAELKNPCAKLVKHNLLLARELLRITQRFEAAGVLAISLKGPLLAETLYSNLTLRVFSDLDILIAPGDSRKAVEVLTEMGWTPCYGLDTHAAVTLLNTLGEISLEAAQGPARIDLHTTLIPTYLGSPSILKRWWGRSRSVPFKGFSLRALSPEDQLLYLCVHGTKHGWAQLKWICDVSRQLILCPDMDWTALFEEADRTRTSTALHLGAYLAHRWYETPLPTEILARIASDRLVPRLAEAVEETLLGPKAERSMMAKVVPVGDLMSIQSPLRARLDFIRCLLKPTPMEFKALKLPPSLFFLYPALRVARLSWKYGARLPGGCGHRMRDYFQRRRSITPE